MRKHGSSRRQKCVDNARIAILTAGKDRPYALGLAGALIARGIRFDFVASDEMECRELRLSPLVRFLNFRGDQSSDAALLVKVRRVIIYYIRLMWYAANTRCRMFHILWNNKFETFDRTFLLLYYKMFGKRLVFTAHNVNKNKRDANDSWWNRFTLRIQYTLVDEIFVHTSQMKHELLTDFQVPSEKVAVIPFGINNSVPDTALSHHESKSRLGLQPHHKTLLFFGNIAPYKGLEYLVKAFAMLIRKDRDLRLIIAGRPKGSEAYWQGITDMLRELNLSEFVVQKIEYVPDADTEIFFKAADAFVLPYTHIFQSGVLFLGYNFGLPVVATDVGSLREDIVEGETGYVCRRNDPQDLARTIERYFDGPLYSNLDQCRSAIRRYAHDRYSWTKVGEITESVYSRYLPSGSSSAQGFPLQI
jgi:D-inositol-3-phosphate glycosyltransferase